MSSARNNRVPFGAEARRSLPSERDCRRHLRQQRGGFSERYRRGRTRANKHGQSGTIKTARLDQSVHSDSSNVFVRSQNCLFILKIKTQGCDGAKKIFFKQSTFNIDRLRNVQYDPANYLNENSNFPARRR